MARRHWGAPAKAPLIASAGSRSAYAVRHALPWIAAMAAASSARAARTLASATPELAAVATELGDDLAGIPGVGDG